MSYVVADSRLHHSFVFWSLGSSSSVQILAFSNTSNKMIVFVDAIVSSLHVLYTKGHHYAR
jgi:hypothetical protein